METCFQEIIAGIEVHDASGVRGIAGGQPVRLTHTPDGKSVLLHELDASIPSLLAEAAFDPRLPSFATPFVTSFAGILSFLGKYYLVELLPPAVPLLDVWTFAVLNKLTDIFGMLKACDRQLQLALDQLHSQGQGHGAVCVQNVVLTTNGIYGFLQAGIATPQGWLCLRPAPNSEEPVFHCRTDEPTPANESKDEILHELIAIAAVAAKPTPNDIRPKDSNAKKRRNPPEDPT
jgi:hypothetical protein